MIPTGAEDADIYFLGTAPTHADDNSGQHFSGAVEVLLEPYIPYEWKNRIRYNSTIRCHPGDRIPVFTEFEACRPSIIRDIEKTKPKAVFGFDDFPLKWLDIQKQTPHWRGRCLPIQIGKHVCWYYHFTGPAFLLGLDSYKRTEPERALEFDLKHAFEEVETLPAPVIHTKEYASKNLVLLTGVKGDLDKLAKLLEWAKDQDDIGVDYETNCLRPYQADSRILTVAVGTDAKAIAFAYQHSQSKWAKDDLAKVTKLWIDFLRHSKRKAVHNLMFEMEWTAYKFGYDLLRASDWGCSQMQASILDERTGNKEKDGPLSLGFLTRQHFGLNIKTVSSLDRKKLSEEDLELVLRYNAIDARYHHLLYKAQAQRLLDADMVGQYKIRLRRIPTCVLTQLKGILVDQAHTAKLHKEYSATIGKLQTKISFDPDAKKFAKVFKHEFNPESPEDVKKLFRDMLKRDEGHQKDGKYSTDEDTLDTIDHPLSSLIVALRGARKLDSTYLYEPWPDGLVHAVFNPGFFVTTGRLCVSGDTILETDLGPVKIADLDLEGAFKNAKIKTHTGNWQPITAKWFKGYENMVRLKFSNGGSITCTAGHRLLTRVGWQHAGSIRLKDYVADAKSVEKRHYTRMPEESILWACSEHADFRRTGVCSFLSSVRTSGAFRIPVRIDAAYAESSKDMVETVVRTSIGISKTSQLFGRSEGEYSWSEPSTKISIHKRTSRKMHRTGSYKKSNCYGVGNIGQDRGKKFNNIQITDTHWTALSFHKFQRNRLDPIGIYSAWDKRGNVAAALFKRSTSIRNDDVRCFSQIDFSVGPDSTYNARRKWTIWRKAPRTMLVSKFGRDVYSGSSFRDKRTSYQGVESGEGFENGFSFAQQKVSYRNRWWASFHSGHHRKRQNQGSNRISSRDNNISHIRCAGQNSNEGYFGEDFYYAQVEEIQDCGVQAVWDITVEKDHSYIAQGVIHHNSSESPNLQNIPKREKTAKEIRRQLVAPPGHSFVSFDYGQIEARVFAMITKDKAFCKALWERFDVHGYWAERLARAYPERIGGIQNITDKQVMKDFRNEPIKSGWTFGLFFGCKLETAADYCKIPVERLEPEHKEFRRMFKGIFEWHQEIWKFYQEYGYVESLTGHRRRVPLSWNEAINMPIQSTACEIIMDGMNRLSEHATKTGDMYFQPNINIHDDLTFVLPTNRIDYYAEEIIKQMLDTTSFDFINIPLVAEMSVGENLRDMHEVLVASSDGKWDFK